MRDRDGERVRDGERGPPRVPGRPRASPGDASRATCPRASCLAGSDAARDPSSDSRARAERFRSSQLIFAVPSTISPVPPRRLARGRGVPDAPVRGAESTTLRRFGTLPQASVAGRRFYFEMDTRRGTPGPRDAVTSIARCPFARARDGWDHPLESSLGDGSASRPPSTVDAIHSCSNKASIYYRYSASTPSGPARGRPRP